MTQNRLNNLLVCQTHQDLFDSADILLSMREFIGVASYEAMEHLPSSPLELAHVH